MPVPAPNPGPNPSTDTTTAECFPTGWGILNPVEWVYKPVKCALHWAFVPRNPLNTGQVQTALDDSAIGNVRDFIGDVRPSDVVPQGGHCGVLVDVDVPALMGGNFRISTCEGWWQDASGTPRMIVGLAFMLGAILGGFRMVMRTINVVPDPDNSIAAQQKAVGR